MKLDPGPGGLRERASLVQEPTPGPDRLPARPSGYLAAGRSYAQPTPPPPSSSPPPLPPPHLELQCPAGFWRDHSFSEQSVESDVDCGGLAVKVI